MKKIGITGGIGSGKSTVARLFQIMGVPVYYADHRAKDVVNSDQDVRNSIVQLLGEDAYNDNGYNTRYVSSQVFDNPSLLEQLNAIIHPAVSLDFENWVKRSKSDKYILKEAALLFETGSYKELDQVIYVSAPEELRISRVLKRDPQRTDEEIRNIIERQWPDKDKSELSDYIISNSSTDLLIPQVLQLHHHLSK